MNEFWQKLRRNTLTGIPRKARRRWTSAARIRVANPRMEKNTAYYIVGTRKNLIEQKIIKRKGGFLGIGKRSAVSSDSDLQNYTKIDIRKVTEVKLSGKKIKILTSHPSGSYKLIGDAKKPTAIQINNPSEFWQKSKFLVIEIDD